MKQTYKKPFNKKFFLIASILILVLGFIAYANSLNGQFVYDDDVFIKDNSLTKNISSIPISFTKNFGEGEDVGRLTIAYRPLQQISNTLNYAICKLDVRGYHLTNIILHIAVALCIYWLVYVLFSNDILSLITATLFVVHPIQTEAISYISGRGDPLALFFMLLCMIIYIKLLHQNRFNIIGFFFLLLSYLCALFSKEHSILLPALLLLYHFVFGKKIKAIEFLSLLSLALIYLVLRATHLNHIAPSLSTDTVFDRIPGVFVALFTYIKLFFLPFSLHMEYGQKLFEWTDLRAIGGASLTLIIFFWAYLKRENKIIPFCVGWFFLSLLPVSNLYKINFYMAEHFLYIPSLGFFLLISYALSLLYNDPRYKIVTVILTACAVLFFLSLTIKQNNYWKDPLTFYTKTLEFSPDSSNIYNNLGRIYQNEGALTKALSYYTKAIETDPNNDVTYYNRGSIYDSNGNYTQAIVDFNKAIKLNPNYPKSYNNRGHTYNNKGDYAQAILDYNKSIELDPTYPLAYNNRGDAYLNKGSYLDAIRDFNKAIELNPNYAEAYNHRGNAYNHQGNYAQALLDYNKALELNPNYAEAYNNRGTFLGNKKNYAEALLDYNKAIDIDPKYEKAYLNRGIIYDREDNFDEAISSYSKAIELNPRLIEAYSNRGSDYNNKGNYPKAILDYNQVIEINAKDWTAYFNRGIAHNNQGHLEQAVLDYSKAIELKPDLAQAYHNRASVYYNQKEYRKALSDLQKAQELGAKIDPGFLEAVTKASTEPTQ